MDSWEAVLLVIATIGSVAAAAGTWLQERRSSAAQLAALQRKLDAVMTHLGIAEPGSAEVIRHLEDGKIVEAVRVYRRQTGASLLEAKQAVDRIAAGPRHPEQ